MIFRFLKFLKVRYVH